MYDWDSDMKEDAPLAVSLDFVYRHLPTTQDAAIGVMANRSFFAFDGAPKPHDLWEVNTRLVSKLNSNFGLIAKIVFCTAQSNGSDERLIKRFGGDLTMFYNNCLLYTSLSGKIFWRFIR